MVHSYNCTYGLLYNLNIILWRYLLCYTIVYIFIFILVYYFYPTLSVCLLVVTSPYLVYIIFQYLFVMNTHIIFVGCGCNFRIFVKYMNVIVCSQYYISKNVFNYLLFRIVYRTPQIILKLYCNYRPHVVCYFNVIWKFKFK